MPSGVEAERGASGCPLAGRRFLAKSGAKVRVIFIHVVERAGFAGEEIGGMCNWRQDIRDAEIRRGAAEAAR